MWVLLCYLYQLYWSFSPHFLGYINSLLATLNSRDALREKNESLPMAVHITVDGPSAQPRLFRRQVVRPFFDDQSIVLWKAFYTEPRAFSFIIERPDTIRRKRSLQWNVIHGYQSDSVCNREYEGTSEAGLVLLKYYCRKSDGMLKTRQIFFPFVPFFNYHSWFPSLRSTLLPSLPPSILTSLPTPTISSGSYRCRADNNPRRWRDYCRSEPSRRRW